MIFGSVDTIQNSINNYTQSISLATVAFDNWKNTIKNSEKTQTQTLNTTSHSNATPHSNTHSNQSPHTDDSYSYYYHSNSHSNYYYHSNGYSPVNYSYHYNYYYHSNYTSTPSHHNTSSPHSNSHNNNHSNNSSYYNYESRHFNRHSNSSGHTNYYGGGGWHGDRAPHSNGSPHVNSSSHSNRSPHSNGGSSYSPHSNGHSNYYYHNNSGTSNYYHVNTGFDHQNYIPSDPHFFNITKSEEILTNSVLRNTVQIGFYAYDKNIDGVGSQDSVSKNVKYYLQIKPASGGSWQTLVNGSTTEMYNLNTKNYSDGNYLLKAWAKNDSISANGVTKTYEGTPTTLPIKILQNISPTISVTNGNEFVNFIFGYSGALSPTNVFKYYDNLYAKANPQPSNYEGILVKVNMKDGDKSTATIQNWQKGQAIFSAPDNSQIAVTDIIWENNSNIISSENAEKKGFAFIPLSIYESMADTNGCKMKIVVTDYSNAACTQPLSTVAVTKDSNNKTMILNIDVTAPYVSATYADSSSITISKQVDLDYHDNGGGLLYKQYNITNQGVNPPTSWSNYGSTLTINNLGNNYIWYRVADRAMNEKIGCFGPFQIGYLNSVQHNQLIRVNQSNAVEISDPNTILSGTLPKGVFLDAVNTASNQQLLTYRLRTVIPRHNLAEIKNIQIELCLGKEDREDIGERINQTLINAVLKHYNTKTGNYDIISEYNPSKGKYSLSVAALSGLNNYLVNFDENVISANGSGEYLLEYVTDIKENSNNFSKNELNVIATNESIVKIIRKDNTIVTEPMEVLNHKNIINTKYQRNLMAQ